MDKKWLIAAALFVALAGITVVAVEMNRRNVPGTPETANVPAGELNSPKQADDPANAPADPMNRRSDEDPANAPADPAKRPISSGPEAAGDDLDFPPFLLEDESAAAAGEDLDADAVGSDKIMMENYDRIYEDDEI